MAVPSTDDPLLLADALAHEGKLQAAANLLTRASYLESGPNYRKMRIRARLLHRVIDKTPVTMDDLYSRDIMNTIPILAHRLVKNDKQRVEAEDDYKVEEFEGVVWLKDLWGLPATQRWWPSITDQVTSRLLGWESAFKASTKPEMADTVRHAHETFGEIIRIKKH